MVTLSRTVRFCLNAATGASPGKADQAPARHNTFAAWPPMRGLGRYYELQIAVTGEPDPVTGYLMNISQIDQAVHEHVLPLLSATLRDHPDTDAVPLGALMRDIANGLQPSLGGALRHARFLLTPYYALTIEVNEMDRVLITQTYEFAASHRLHCPSLSDQENRDLFGKCNHVSGHGHNYRFEVTVHAPIHADGGVTPVEALDAAVHHAVVEKFDHMHLNIDLPEFAETISSVENIAKVIHGLLQPPTEKLGLPLKQVTVWETSKTACTYPAL